MFCTQCGKEIPDKAVFCIHCGCGTQNNATVANVNDAPSTGMAVLGFFIPLVGLIMWLVDKDTRPLRAKSAGKGALIGVIVSIVLSVIYGAIVGCMVSGL